MKHTSHRCEQHETLEIVAGQTNSQADDTDNTLTVECFAKGK